MPRLLRLLRLLPLATLAATLSASPFVSAQTLRDDARGTGLYAQYGRAADRAQTATLGVLIPWRWTAAGGALTGYWDLYASHWRAESPTGSGDTHALTQIGVLPTLRWRFDEGRSPFYVEGGTLGLTVTDSLYNAPGKPFSTRFNFASHIGVGYSFGAGGEHELGLRLQHQSNGGIEKPNPGENFLQLRYGLRF